MRSGAILVGGASRRMGQDKALLQIEGRTLVTRLAAALGSSCDEVILVGGAPDRFRELGLAVRWVPDPDLGAGPLCGVLGALEAAQGEACVILATDLPFVTPPLVAALQAHLAHFDVVAYPGDYGPEPLLACYRREALHGIKSMLQHGEYRAQRISAFLRVGTLPGDVLDLLDPHRQAATNLNSPDDIGRAALDGPGGTSGGPGSAC